MLRQVLRLRVCEVEDRQVNTFVNYSIRHVCRYFFQHPVSIYALRCNDNQSSEVTILVKPCGIVDRTFDLPHHFHKIRPLANVARVLDLTTLMFVWFCFINICHNTKQNNACNANIDMYYVNCKWAHYKCVTVKGDTMSELFEKMEADAKAFKINQKTRECFMLRD